jgi:hypothetical protein
MRLIFPASNYGGMRLKPVHVAFRVQTARLVPLEPLPASCLLSCLLSWYEPSTIEDYGSVVSLSMQVCTVPMHIAMTCRCVSLRRSLESLTTSVRLADSGGSKVGGTLNPWPL